MMMIVNVSRVLVSALLRLSTGVVHVVSGRSAVTGGTLDHVMVVCIATETSTCFRRTWTADDFRIAVQRVSACVVADLDPDGGIHDEDGKHGNNDHEHRINTLYYLQYENRHKHKRS